MLAHGEEVPKQLCPCKNLNEKDKNCFLTERDTNKKKDRKNNYMTMNLVLELYRVGVYLVETGQLDATVFMLNRLPEKL